ncbi:MAG: C40 family peptidase [Micrococcales bacterium]|nr:C40 family peptidase [Micrococcales bacterium]
MLGVAGIQARMAELRALVVPQPSPTLDFATTLQALTGTAGGTDAFSGLAELAGLTTNQSGQGTTAQDFIAQARKYLGTPYVWGGESLSEGGLDCSGLVVRALADLGITDIPRTARQQGTIGTAVGSLAEAKPGDLLIFNNGKHVSIYLGDNRMIESPRPGGKVHETTVWNTPTAIRRILPQQTAAPVVNPVVNPMANPAFDAAAAQRALLTLTGAGW